MRRYWRGGQTKNALLPRYNRSGGKGKPKKSGGRKRGRPDILAQATGQQRGVNVDETMRRYFQRGIKLFYETRQKNSLRRAYDLTLQKFFHRGYEEKSGAQVPVMPPAEALPTFRQFQYWYTKERQAELALRAREGDRRFELHHRAVLGDSTQMAYGPGSVYQIDATPADVYLVSSLDTTRIIGRPVLYFVVDVFSRMIVGFSATLEGPSWLGAMLALENTTCDKVAFCAEYDISISPDEWPSHHLPEKLLADRGELEGYNADNLVNALNITVANTPPYRADWKGIVERYFRLSNDRVTRWLPGAVRADSGRGDPDYRLDANLTLNEFRKILIWTVLTHNNHYRMAWYPVDKTMMRDQIEPYPTRLWQWGIENRVGHLRTMPQEVIRLNLLPQGVASIARDGIHFQGLRYTCERAEKENWYINARERGRQKIDVAYDMRRADTLYLRLSDHRQIAPCHLVPKFNAYQGLDWYEAQEYIALGKQRSKAAATGQLQANAAYQSQVDNIVQQAQARQEQSFSKQSKLARLKGIRDNRRQERQLERGEDNWQLGDTPEPDAPENIESPDTEDVYIPEPKKIDLFRQVIPQHQEDNNDAN